MSRYLVQRTFPDRLEIPHDAVGRAAIGQVIANNAERGVTWVHTYVAADHRTTFCIYDAPDPEAVRECAAANGHPVDTITEVSVLDPYRYGSSHEA